MDTAILQLMLEGLFTVIMAGIGFIIKGMSSDIRELTHAVTTLRVEMIRDYVGKEEWVRIRDRVHELDSEVATLQFVFKQQTRNG